MEAFWFISLIALWGVVLVNLWLTLRIVRWLRAMEDLDELVAERERLPELSIGIPAPDFKARTLTGEAVRLDSYLGRSVLFIFISPHCRGCRMKIPELIKLSALAKERAGIEFILVSDSNSIETSNWIETIHKEDGIEINLPILVAPQSASEFLKIYNPRGWLPYYCLIDKHGIVQTRDLLDRGDWSKLQRQWEGLLEMKPFSRSPNRYR
jgi:alkyl hydroperoxide reductase subunit AhpC